MKKWIALLVVLCTILSFVACGESDVTTVLEAVAESIAMPEFDKTATIEPGVIYDGNGIVVSANALNYENYRAELAVTVTNNTDGELNVICGSGHLGSAVNGYMIAGGYFNYDIPAGESTDAEIGFDYKEMMVHGITEIADITVCFLIDTGDDEYYSDQIKIETSAAVSYDYSANTYEKVINNGVFEALTEGTVDYYSNEKLVELEDVALVSVAIATNKDGEPVLLFETENNTKQIMQTTMRNVCINGHTVYDGLWSSDRLGSGTRHVDYIDLPYLASKYDGDISDISAISELSFEFGVGDSFTNITSKETVVISLPNVILPQEEAETTEEILEEVEVVETEEEPEVEQTAEEITEETAVSDAIRPEFKAAMDSYEAFYEEYCEIMKKYMDNPMDLELLDEYSDVMSRATEVDAAFDAWDDGTMNEAEYEYYFEVFERVMEMLAGIYE